MDGRYYLLSITEEPRDEKFIPELVGFLSLIGYHDLRTGTGYTYHLVDSLLFTLKDVDRSQVKDRIESPIFEGQTLRSGLKNFSLTAPSF
jgi:hypothetical protein